MQHRDTRETDYFLCSKPFYIYLFYRFHLWLVCFWVTRFVIRFFLKFPFSFFNSGCWNVCVDSKKSWTVTRSWGNAKDDLCIFIYTSNDSVICSSYCVSLALLSLATSLDGKASRTSSSIYDFSFIFHSGGKLCTAPWIAILLPRARLTESRLLYIEVIREKYMRTETFGGPMKGKNWLKIIG